uniref:Uncharacterized protein n=1 Tax=viral metagenome TaxID=1070528 RepID=A0A6C0DUH3_9ZZZZ
MTTYIKNKGIAQTYFQDSHHKKKANEIKWNAKYDGSLANIKVDVNNDGKRNKYRVQLNNEDLANILSIPTVNQSLEQRLQNDFLSDYKEYDEPDDFVMPEIIQMREQEPDPSLFRVNILDSSSKKQQYSSPFSKPCMYDNELTSLPNLKSLSGPESILTELDHPQQQIEIVSPTKMTRREKHSRLKTPSPKTMRIHYTSPASNSTGKGSAKGKNTRRRRRSPKRKSRVAKFFSKFF